MLRILVCCLVAVFSLTACKSAGLTAGRDGVSSQRFDFTLAAPPGFRLLAEGAGSASVPADIPVGPSARTSYALYAGDPENPGALLFALVAELPTPAWRFALESDKALQDFDFSKENRDGRFLTLRTRPIGCDDDWFCALAEKNGGETAPVMLARRHSFTPFVYTRVVLEYREPAPVCLRELAFEAPSGGVLWVERPEDQDCAAELDAFNKRADAVLAVGGTSEAEPRPAFAFAVPDFAPNMALLCGTAEHVERDNPDFRP